MNEISQLQWVKTNLGNAIKSALEGSPYTEDLLAAMTVRETGIIIQKQIDPVDWFKFVGDFTQRPGEKQKSYHGYGPWQVDKGSFSGWIDAGNWLKPMACAQMAVDILKGKRRYITSHAPNLTGDALDRANVAAYNCGEGNVIKVIGRGLDIDAYTANQNYSAEVWRLREIYKTL